MGETKQGVTASEPAVKCPACGAEIPLSSGWGPVGDKQFQCAACGEISDLVVDLR